MNNRITEDGYDRDVRQYEIDITDKGMEYDVGDILAIHPHNPV